MVSIVDLRDSDGDRIDQIAEFLFKCFRKYAPEWLPDLESCKEEVQESFEPGRRSRVLIDGDGRALGWVSTIIDDNVWEIHPIAVSPKEQRKGYGAMLINDVAQLARAGGAVAMWAGTSDETGSTSFSDIDLYKNPASALARRLRCAAGSCDQLLGKGGIFDRGGDAGRRGAGQTRHPLCKTTCG